MNVDFESRVDFDRLRQYRSARARQALEESGLGAVLCFDMNNIRYLSQHEHRRVGSRQAHAVRRADPHRTTHLVGLRLRGEGPPPALALGSHPRTPVRG